MDVISQNPCTLMAYWKKVSSELNQLTTIRKQNTNSVLTITNSFSTGSFKRMLSMKLHLILKRVH